MGKKAHVRPQKFGCGSAALGTPFANPTPFLCHN
jgi:hypothetical protein